MEESKININQHFTNNIPILSCAICHKRNLNGGHEKKYYKI